MKTFLFYPVTFFLALWLQVLVNHFLGGSWFFVQGLLVVVVYWGLTRGAMAGCVMGFLWGLTADASSLGLLGEQALLFATAGYVAGSLRRQLDETKPWTQGIFTGALSLGVTVGTAIIDRIFLGNSHAVHLSMWLQPVWNGLFAPLLFILLQSWAALWDMSLENR